MNICLYVCLSAPISHILSPNFTKLSRMFYSNSIQSTDKYRNKNPKTCFQVVIALPSAIWLLSSFLFSFSRFLLLTVNYFLHFEYSSFSKQMQSLVSGINFRLLSVNHALTCAIRTHIFLYEWHFLRRFHRLTTFIIHHPVTLSFQA